MTEPLGDFDYHEENTQTGLDLKRYNNWRDWAYKLQTARTTLPGESKESSSDLGIYAHNIALNTIHGLREGRVDNLGNPYLLLNDEVDDAKVITDASLDERKKFFIKGVVATAKEFWVDATDERLKSFVVSSIALGSALTGSSLEEVKDLLMSEISPTKWRNPTVKNLFLDQIRKADPKRVNELQKYLEFSQDQMTLEEEHALLRKFEPKKEIGAEPIEINGQEFGFVGSKNPAWLTEEDLEALEPMRKALRISRKEVVKEAQLLAKRLFNISEEDIYRAPEWWVEGSDLQGLKSTEGLLFIPNLDNVKGKIPTYMSEIFELYGRGGWFHLEINENDYERPVILQANKLSS